MSRAMRRWADLFTTDFATLDPERAVAVLRLAATEQHGPHLPLSVDADLVEGVMAVAGEALDPGAPVFALPVQAVGLSPEHQAFAGTLTLRPETVIRLWTEIGESVARAGVRKLILFNGHGGHAGLMDVVARDLRTRCGMLVYSVSWFNLPLQDDRGQDLNAQFPAEEHRFGIHAGQIETAMMLSLSPQRLRMQEAIHFPSTSQVRAQKYPVLGNGRSAKLGWQIQDYNPQGAVGNAAAASAEQGRVLVAAAGRSLAALLAEVVDLPLDTLAGGPLS